MHRVVVPHVFMLGVLFALSGALSLPVWAAELALSVDGDRYSLQAEDVPLGEVLAELEAVTGVGMDIPPELGDQRVTLSLEGVTYEQIIEAVAGSHALVYERDAEGHYRLVGARLTSQMLLDERDLSWSERRDIRRKKREVQRALDELSELYGYAGALNYDDAKALIAQRKAREQELIERLAALGPGGARAIREVYGEMESAPGATRGQMLLIQALEKIEDEDASLVLGALYEEDDRVSLQREIIASLAHRPDSLDTLLSLVAQEDDERLKGPGMMAMADKPEALPFLGEVIQSEEETRDVRQEAVRSVGELGGEEAQQLLTSVAVDPAVDPAIRVSAVSELWRSFGEGARATLEALSNDPDEKIRNVSSTMLRRLDTNGA